MTKEPWQLALREIRNNSVDKIKGYLDRLDRIILDAAKKGKAKIPVEKNEIEAIKLALKTLGALGEEKPEKLERLTKKKITKEKKETKVPESKAQKKIEQSADDFLGKWKKNTTSSLSNSV